MSNDMCRNDIEVLIHCSVHNGRPDSNETYVNNSLTSLINNGYMTAVTVDEKMHYKLTDKGQAFVKAVDRLSVNNEWIPMLEPEK